MRRLLPALGLVLLNWFLFGCDMSDRHIPIDHKDDSPEYRAQVWQAVSQRVGSELTPLPADTTLSGTWNVELEMMGTRIPFAKYEFKEGNAVAITPLTPDSSKTTEETYSVPNDGRMNVYGEVYHVANTASGELVLFNGDQSLVLVATSQ